MVHSRNWQQSCFSVLEQPLWPPWPHCIPSCDDELIKLIIKCYLALSFLCCCTYISVLLFKCWRVTHAKPLEEFVEGEEEKLCSVFSSSPPLHLYSLCLLCYSSFVPSSSFPLWWRPLTPGQRLPHPSPILFNNRWMLPLCAAESIEL